MYKIVLVIALKSILFSQDKMILKSGKEIVLKNNINLKTINQSWFIENHSRRYSKESIALITLNNGDIIFRSGMPISEYEMLDIVGKATADAKTSSKKFKNINQRLLDGLNEEQRQIYLTTFGNPNSSPIRTFGIFACVFTLLITSLLLQSPSFMAGALG